MAPIQGTFVTMIAAKQCQRPFAACICQLAVMFGLPRVGNRAEQFSQSKGRCSLVNVLTAARMKENDGPPLVFQFTFPRILNVHQRPLWAELFFIHHHFSSNGDHPDGETKNHNATTNEHFFQQI
jgi:hypothetical protein